MSRLRVAVVGVGHLGQHHARVLAAHPAVELVAVADTRRDQAEAVAARHGTTAVADWRSLIGRVDAVSIAVPTMHHRAVAEVFLDQGIATMIEKPLAPSLADAEAIAALARARGTLLQVGHIERFNPALAALDGLPLRPRYITCERFSGYTFRSTDIGVVLDLMIHDLDLVLSLVPAPVRTVTAVGMSVFGGHEDMANARVEFSDGCVATLSASRASFDTARTMRVWGVEGYATLDFASRQATLVRPSEQLRQGQFDLAEVDLSQPAALKEHVFGKILRVDQVLQGDGPDALALELEDFVRAVRQGTRPRVNGEDALRAMRLADQILQGINTHEWEEITPALASTSPHDYLVPSGAGGGPGAPSPAFRGPISWRNPRIRQNSPTSAGH